MPSNCTCRPINDFETDTTNCVQHDHITYIYADHKVPMNSTSFAEFSAINVKRHLEWPRSTDQPPEGEWDLSAWGCAVAEEAGEVCGAIKRYNRIHTGHIIKGKTNQPLTQEDAIELLKKEIGDTITYLDLLAQEIDSSLEDCVRSAFNGVSEREGLPHRI